MIPFVYNSKHALVLVIVMTMITLGDRGGSSYQDGHSRRCLTYSNMLGLGNIYISVLTF